MIETLVAALPFHGVLRGSAALYSTVNAAHILGIALLVGSIINTDLRLAGLWRGETWRDGMREALPLARLGLILAAITGYFLFMNRPLQYLGNPAFQLKALLIAAAMVNIAVFYALIQRPERTGAMRLAGAASLCFWIGAVFAGRAVAFY